MQTQIPTQQAQQNQSRAEHKSQESAQPQFEDSRPEATAQLRLQSLMANSAQSTQLKSMQTMMAANTPTKNLGQSPAATNPIPVQRMEEEEPLQAKIDEPVQREQIAAPNAENPNAETPPDSTPPPKPNNTGLPDNLKTGIENLSGISMDHVKVHYNSDKPAQLQAHAYAQGSEIHVAPGQEKHLPHEAWHVVQQAQGRVKPTVQMKGGVGVNDDEGVEREADFMGMATGNGDVKSFALAELSSAKPVIESDTVIAQLHDTRVVQRISGYGERANNYKEINIDNNGDTDVENLAREEKTLALVGADDADLEDDDVRSATETGYKVLQLGNGESQDEWQIAAPVLHWSTPRRLATRDSFNLPVSCIESAEHVVHHLHSGGNVPNYDPANLGVNQVGLHLKHSVREANERAINISTDPVEDINFDDWKSFDFDAAQIQVGEGLLAVNPTNPGETLHAVVVVGKSTRSGQLVILERNAGTTTGDNMYVDNNWLVNVYDSPEGFRASLGADFIMGKLAAF